MSDVIQDDSEAFQDQEMLRELVGWARSHRVLILPCGSGDAQFDLSRVKA